jgi:ABC-type lipoprotein export system ATPase subunit
MSERPAGTEVEVTNVTKLYEGNVRALDGIDLRAEAGEFVAITGPSGCGKSTLLHLLAALDVPTSGSIRVGGRNLREIRDLARFRRLEVGLVFQLHNLLPQLSILANVEVAMFGTHLRRHERRLRALDLLGRVDLAGRELRLPTQLSGGERQRVAIARALANRPRLLLADEPTGNLDSHAKVNVLRLLRSVNQEGVTVFIVTHDQQIAEASDRIVEMEDGRTVSPRSVEAKRGPSLDRPTGATS